MATENKETSGELGMSLYEKIVDMAEGDCTELPTVISILKEADSSGQFLTSSARYLWAVDRERFATQVSELIEAAIDRDRERRYISSLLEAIWGHDYRVRAEELKASDDNFRRIYKRIHPAG